MSMESINTIRGVEESMDQARLEAKASAQKLLAEAEKEGRALVEQSRARAAEKTAEVMEAAGKRADKRRLDILAETNRDCRRLVNDAQERMAEAAGIIIGRVVER